MSDAEDPVARNRAASPRRTPGRPPVSAPVLRSVLLVTAGALVAATLVLITVLLAS